PRPLGRSGARQSRRERRRARRRRPPAPDGRTHRRLGHRLPRAGADLGGRRARGQAVGARRPRRARPALARRSAHGTAAGHGRAGAAAGRQAQAPAGGRGPPRAVRGRRHEYRRRLGRAGSAALNELGIGDANRQLLTADHARAEGVDVQWPGGVRVTRMEIAKPWVLFERETSGRFPLVDLLTPRARAAPKPRTSRDPGPREPTEPLRFSLGTLALTDGFGRFVDHATDPDFAEELSAVNLTMVGLGNTPTDKARTALRATLGPSAPLSISGDLGTVGAPLAVDAVFTLGGYAAPRTNAYLRTLFGWTAPQGAITLAAHYRIEGDELEATNDVGADGLEVVKPRDCCAKPPKWPIGLPLDTFVSLLKDRHGHVELSLPVHGRLSSPQFDLGDAIWHALRVFTRRFPKRQPPAALDELLAALAAQDRAPAAAQAALAQRRVLAVRDALAARDVDAGRLAAQTAPPAVEGEGTGRVEFEITR